MYGTRNNKHYSYIHPQSLSYSTTRAHFWNATPIIMITILVLLGRMVEFTHFLNVLFTFIPIKNTLSYLIYDYSYWTRWCGKFSAVLGLWWHPWQLRSPICARLIYGTTLCLFTCLGFTSNDIELSINKLSHLS